MIAHPHLHRSWLAWVTLVYVLAIGAQIPLVVVRHRIGFGLLTAPIAIAGLAALWISVLRARRGGRDTPPNRDP